jgi:hypothetical protein
MSFESPIYVAKKALLGMVLGDGSIAYSKSSKKASLTLTHSLNQLPYMVWKLHILMPIIGIGSIRLDSVTLKGYVKQYKRVCVRSQASLYLGHVYNDFYFERNGKVQKEIHSNVLNRLDPLSLAVWYQDDGGVQSKNGSIISSISLAVCSFSDSEIELIMKYFYDIWHIKWAGKVVSSQYFVLVSSGDSMRSFIEIIRPYVCEWMNYKINSSDSAKHLSIEEGDDMIRSFEKSKELNRNIQLHDKELIENNDLPLDEEEYTKLRIPYGVKKLLDEEMQTYTSFVSNSKVSWRKMENINGITWYMFLHGSFENMLLLRKKFGGYMRNYGNHTEFRIGGRSAFKMCYSLNITNIPCELYNKYDSNYVESV